MAVCAQGSRLSLRAPRPAAVYSATVHQSWRQLATHRPLALSDRVWLDRHLGPNRMPELARSAALHGFSAAARLAGTHETKSGADSSGQRNPVPGLGYQRTVSR